MTTKDIEVVSSKIDEEKENLDRLSLEIWKKPELANEEVHAHSILTDALEEYGFSVQRHFILKTAFRAEYSRGSGEPVVAVLCEYDALPELGHACGHNLIAQSGVAAAIGIKAALESDSEINGKVVVLGCPAEESSGGKIRLLEGGAFACVDVAMMVHPTNAGTIGGGFLCIVQVDVTYKGKEAHASAYPWEGKNALDAAVAAYVNISLMRQHIKPWCKIHGIITNGGKAPNIIPEEAGLSFYIRAPDLKELNELKEKARSCFDSAALATGCEVDCKFHESDAYLNVIENDVIISLFKEYSETFGAGYLSGLDSENRKLFAASGGSTDMGNVSYAVPSIHALYSIGEHKNHTKEFTEQSATPSAHEATRNIAKVMALSGVRIMRSSEVLEAVKRTFRVDLLFNES